jgi:hypothetical protein
MIPVALPESVDRCLGNAGSGFLMGQGFALIGSSYHALMYGPPGHRLSEFFSHLSRHSFSSGVELTTWSIVSSQTDPITKRLLKSGWAQSALNGALTGAILALRNGWAGMVSSAATGAGQSIAVSLLQVGIGTVWRPIQEWKTERARQWFKNKRVEVMFVTPARVIGSAFFSS